MRNYYIFMGILAAVVLSSIVAGFTVIGSPFIQQARAHDQKRTADFTQIKYAVENYYSTYRILPSDLSQLKTVNAQLSTTDPQTKKEYDYQKVSSTSYKLCTTFSTDSKDSADTPYPYTPPSINAPADKTTHIKGYDCFILHLPVYLQPTPTPYMPMQTYVTPGTTSSTSSLCALSYTAAGKVVSDNGQFLGVTMETNASSHNPSAISVAKNATAVKIIGSPKVGDSVTVTEENCTTTITKN